MRRRWRQRPCPEGADTRLQDALGLHPIVARLLASRGIEEPDAAEAFLGARLADHLRSPMLFRQMAKAADRVASALSRGERIGIYGDYDVDGMSGSAVLVRFLRSLGHDPALFIPNRMVDGYGLGENGIARLAAAGTRLMITVDCGGSAHRQIEFAASQGIETLVCDHHQVSGTPLPAHAVLNPIEPDAGFPFHGLCGAGVAFYLAMGTRMRLRDAGATNLPDLRRSLDLVTLGTIADVVPLVEENRVLVKAGLRELLQTGAPGLVALKQISSVTAISASTVGFRLAPRLNAAGRLSDATRGVELLTTEDPQRAAELARELDGENTARRALEAEMLEDALHRIERDPEANSRRSIVLASEDWHPGVVGIVAARLVDRFYRPAVVIAIDASTGIGRGSCRGITGVDLYAALQRSSSSLVTFGGHKMAAGLSIAGDRVDEFRTDFETAVRSLTRAEDFVPQCWVDAELELAAIDDALVDALEQVSPHGAGNPEPVFLVRGATVAGARIVGDTHLKLFLRQARGALSGIAFGMAEAGIEQGSEIDVLLTPERNEWQGRSTLQFRLRDWRPANQQ
jgi:single-stranded-DNA-specific exonuclease